MTQLRNLLAATALTVGLLGTSQGASAAQAAAKKPDVVHLRKVQLVDSQIFGKPTEVVSMLIPMDWKFSGRFPVDLPTFAYCPENAFKPYWEAQSANQLVGYTQFPSMQTVEFRNPLLFEDVRRRGQAGQQFCVQSPPLEPAQFVEAALIPRLRPGARVLRTEPVPALQRKLQADIAALRLPPNVQVRAAAAEVVIGYSIKGQAVEEHIFMIASWRAEGGLGGSQDDMVYSSYTPLFGLRTPAGQFARYHQQFANLIGSTHLNGHFVAAVLESIRAQRTNIFNAMSIEIRQSSEIWQKSWQATHDSQKQREATKTQEKAYDVAGAWSDTVLDVQNYSDSNGQTVQLSGGYNHVYSNGNGEYVMTNDPSYNPAVATGSRWEPISAIPR